MKKYLLIMVFALGSMLVFGQWSTNPAENNMLTPESMQIYDSEIIVNDDGVTYFLYTRPIGNTASYIQIFDKAGYPLFEDYGFKFSNNETWTWTVVNRFLFLDSEGNAIICVSDCRNVSDMLTYTAYKISPTGEMLWGAEGVDLTPGETYTLSAMLDMVTLDDGSHVFAWAYYEMVGENEIGRIKIQRLSHDGEILWDAPVILTSETVSYDYPYLVNAGHNEFIMVYTKGSNKDMVANKYDFDGEAIWPKETLIYQGGFGNIPIWTFLKVIPDEKGGVFVAWRDDRFFTNYETSYAAYVKSDGSHGFVSGVGGQALTYNADDGLRCLYPAITYDAENEYLYAIELDSNPGQSWTAVVAQKLDLTGQLLWGTNGIEIRPIANVNISNNSIQMAEDGNFVAFYMINNEYHNVDIIATKIDGKTGEYAWEDEQVFISEVVSHKAGLVPTSLVNGQYWLTMWEDARVLPETPVDGEGNPKPSDKLHAQRLFVDGTFEAPPVGIENVEETVRAFGVYPNPMTPESEAVFTFNNTAAGTIDISIYSISGQKEAVVYNGNMERGNQKINWNAGALNKGIYLAVITTPGGKETIKFVIR